MLLTFFFRHIPEVIQHGYLYIAQPPLFRVQVGKESTYVLSEEEKDRLVAGAKGKYQITRFKGLGEMNAEQLWDTTMNPVGRVLKKVAIEDASHADEVFSMLMGDEVAPRKRFIQTHAKYADLDMHA